QKMTKQVFTYLIFPFALQINICQSQILEAAWYEESAYEEVQKEKRIRQDRARQNLKTVKIGNENEGVTYEERYDKDGRTIYFLSYHKSSYNISNNSSLANKKLKNEWTYSYNSNGNLVGAVNKHDYIAGTAYGGDVHFSDPSIAGPWTFQTFHTVAEWTYEYDQEGKLTEQNGYIFREPYRYHRTNGYRVYDSQKDVDWKFNFRYDNSGKLIEQLEYRIDISLEKPIYRRVFKYNSANQVIKEIAYSGENIVKHFSFKYDEQGIIIERNNERSHEKLMFRYDNNGNLIQAQKYNREGKLRHQQDFKYNERNLLVEKKYSISIINHSQRNATYIYEYDKKGRVLQKINDNMIYEFEYYEE
ncbi:hypothetical protein JYT51_01210, partial [Candidatus Amoebophilus asiaticus]|nr:hypothetical protein [Candidatus Amoebophilus asiaticus]